MLLDLARLAAVYAVAFAINLVPAFMPSTWMVLAFFRVQYDLPILPLTIGGAFFSGLGRIVLARGAGVFTRRVLRRDEELENVKTYLDERRNYVGLATFAYCLMPLPTNTLFVAAGMIEVNMARVMLGFWAGRALADTFYVWTADRAFDSFANIFESYYSDWLVVVLQGLSLAGALALLLVPWPRWLFRRIVRRRRGSPGTRS